MGKPEIITQGDGSFLNGPELYANDGAIHAEINGNLEPHTNIKLVRSYSHVTGWALPRQTLNTTGENYWGGGIAGPQLRVAFSWLAPRDCALLHCQAIGYAEGSVNGGQDFLSDFSSGVAGTAAAAQGYDNHVNFQVDVYNPRDDTSTGVIGPLSVTSANHDYIAVPSPLVEVPAGNIVQVKLQNSADAHPAFNPYVQFTLLLREEHL